MHCGKHVPLAATKRQCLTDRANDIASVRPGVLDARLRTVVRAWHDYVAVGLLETTQMPFWGGTRPLLEELGDEVVCAAQLV